MPKKKQYRGHYCKICGEIKANEKFSGKGHRNHICKACAKLPVEKRNEFVQIRKVENIEMSGFYISKKDRDSLKKYAKNNKYSESVREFAQSVVLDEYDNRIQSMKEDQEYELEIDEDELIEIYDEEDDEVPF